MKTIEVWYSPITNLIYELEWNPCGCHPFDCLMTYVDYNNRKIRLTYSCADRTQFYLNRKEWERLE